MRRRGWAGKVGVRVFREKGGCVWILYCRCSIFGVGAWERRCEHWDLLDAWLASVLRFCLVHFQVYMYTRIHQYVYFEIVIYANLRMPPLHLTNLPLLPNVGEQIIASATKSSSGLARTRRGGAGRRRRRRRGRRAAPAAKVVVPAPPGALGRHVRRGSGGCGRLGGRIGGPDVVAAPGVHVAVVDGGLGLLWCGGCGGLGQVERR